MTQRKIIDRLRGEYNSTWSFVISIVLLVVLDISALAGLIWRFLFFDLFTVDPVLIIHGSWVYLGLVAILFILALFFSRIDTPRVACMFYATIGVFFAVDSMMRLNGREFTIWPWLIVWILSLFYVMRTFAAELSGHQKTPSEKGE